VSARGETLVEVVVALLLLTVGALALAAGIGEAQRARAAAAASALTLAAAEAWLETWRAGPARGDAAGLEPLILGAWEGRLEWTTGAAAACLETARVEVAATLGEAARVSLSSRRYVAAGVGCGP
jgi:Tfp pilus assembly protein PilV